MLKCHQELLETGLRSSSPSDTSPRLAFHSRDKGGLGTPPTMQGFPGDLCQQHFPQYLCCADMGSPPPPRPGVLADKGRSSVHSLP